MLVGRRCQARSQASVVSYNNDYYDDYYNKRCPARSQASVNNLLIARRRVVRVTNVVRVSVNVPDVGYAR